MHHLLIGYGYCGYYLAKFLLSKQQVVTVLSRHLAPNLAQPGLKHLSHDISQPLHWTKPNTIVYYLIPPPREGEKDSLLQQFLATSHLTIAKVVYFGSSAVYGDHQGAWVDENSTYHIDNTRQLRRLDAEQQWQNYCQQKAIPCLLLRIAGIYGPQRLPVEQALAKTPLIKSQNAPYTNYIYVRDLVHIAYQLAIQTASLGIYNIADGKPAKMGALQQEVAKALNLEPANYESWQQAWEKASPMKKEFIQSSKRLQIKALELTLGTSLSLTEFSQAIKESLHTDSN